MSKKRIYFDYRIPSNVVNIVKDVISDYERREQAIKHGTIYGGVLDRYMELNSAVDKAYKEIEVGLRSYFFKDICENKGYERSGAQSLLSKDAYYRRRRKLIYDIAVELYFI